MEITFLLKRVIHKSKNIRNWGNRDEIIALRQMALAMGQFSLRRNKVEAKTYFLMNLTSLLLEFINYFTSQ